LLDDNTFSNPQVQEKLGKNYVIVKINVNENPDLVSKYKIYAFPVMIFLDSEGNEIKRYEGYIPPDEFLNLI
jgi:thiol:disulfide interchange protein DsbD